MILSLRNINFQNHADVLFKFVSGINLIIGSSRKGKTVVRRALTWIKDNRPTGNAYVSWWDRDNKKNPKTIHFAEVCVRNDNIDKIIKRIKKPEFNGYEVWWDALGEEIVKKPTESFEAIGASVPDEITQILNLSEVNIQRQWDQPFLLSESPGKVAEFFNKLIKLDLIDEVLSKAETMRRQNNRDIEENKNKQEEIAKQIKELSWVESASRQIEAIEKIQNKIEKTNERFDKLNNLIDQYHQYKDELAAIPENLDEPLKLMDSINNLEIKINQKQDKIDEISELLDKYDKYCDELEEIKKFNLSDAEKLMKDIKKIEDKIIKKEQELVKAESILDKYRKQKNLYEDLVQIEEDKKLLENQLGDTCPLCGQPIDKEMLL